ncbi:MAG: hypothetical protein Q8Q09_25585 [Deltaproteobacteria bacterium]|nr:hypothetical protein [Deltaproteobacteria bacterium]
MICNASGVCAAAATCSAATCAAPGVCTNFSGLGVTLCACPSSGTHYTYTMNRGAGDWTSVRASVTVRRLINGVAIGQGNDTLSPTRASFTVADNQQ